MISMEMPSTSSEYVENQIVSKNFTGDLATLLIVVRNTLSAMKPGEERMIISRKPEDGSWLLTTDSPIKKTVILSKRDTAEMPEQSETT